jgi:type II secretion system protein J
MRGPVNDSRGFTLIEILIVLSIIGLMALFLYETFISTSRVTEKIDQEREGYREIRITFDLLTRELSSAYQSYSASTPLPFSGLHDTGPEGSTDSLSFYTNSHLHLIPNQPESELTKVRYALEKNVESPFYRLEHEEYPHFLSNGPAEKEVMLERVKEFSVEYFDGTRWNKEWNKSKTPTSLLPTAVKISVTVVRPDGEQEMWSRQIDLFPLSPK